MYNENYLEVFRVSLCAGSFCKTIAAEDISILLIFPTTCQLCEKGVFNCDEFENVKTKSTSNGTQFADCIVCENSVAHMSR